MIYETEYTIRVGDLNYGNHVGNDKLLTILHDARCAFLHKFGFNEAFLNCENKGLIVKSLSIDYHAQLYLFDAIKVSLSFSEVRSISLIINFVVYKNGEVVAEAKNTLVSFDYKNKKVTKFDEGFIKLVKDYCLD